MKIEIFEQAQLTSDPSDLDIMTDYMLRALKENGAEVIRYDKNVEPEVFDRVQGYALPVIMVDGELLCAGAYDFSLIDKNAFRTRSQNNLSCRTCQSSCSNCQFKCTKGKFRE